MGLAVVDMETCIVNQAECELCVKACPYQAIKTGWNEQTYLVTIDIDADAVSRLRGLPGRSARRR